jgi:hypothetical protein
MAEAGLEFLDTSIDAALTEFEPAVMMAAGPDASRKTGRGRAGVARDSGGGRGGYSGSGPAAPASEVSSVQSQTRERQVGDLFEYSIEKPVTVRRNQSALVPILLKPFAGRSVLLYQKSARPENPIRCVEFENTTGLTLEGGPVTVVEEGSYVGEAMLDTLKPTEKRLVGYAVELAVRVLDNIDSHDDRVTRITIRSGTLKAHYAMLQKTTYTFISKSDREQTAYLDHPRDDSKWKLLDSAKLHETTENYWRFKFPLPPKATGKLVVQQQLTLAQTFNLHEVNDEKLAAWVSAKYLDGATEKVLREAIAQRGQGAALDRKLQEVNEERKAIHQEQKRIRENLATLGDRASEKELRERFIRTLGQQEDRLESIGREEKKLQIDREAARGRLNDLIAGLEFEAAVPE